MRFRPLPPLTWLLVVLFAASASPGATATPTSDPIAPVTDLALQVPAGVRPLFDTWMRDTYVMRGDDGYYYLTGTTAAPGRTQCWDWNDGIRLWRSRDLKSWEPLGLVWSLDRDATWQRAGVTVTAGQRAPTGEVLDGRRRAVWAPELHYLRRTRQWLLAACMNGGVGSFVLRSVSGRPEGPYVNIAGNADGPIFRGIDPSLFEDDDGAVYFVGHNHWIARMKDDLSALAEPMRAFRETPYQPEPYAEGVYLVKCAGRYQLLQTYWSYRLPGGGFSYVPGPGATRYSYDVVVASAAAIYGPYGPRYTAVVGGGHNDLFRDARGRWWSTMFGNPRGGSARTAAFLCRPALVPMRFTAGRFRPDASR